MKNFLYGIFFISIVYPIINGIIVLFSQGIEYLCTCIAVKTAKKQMELPQQEEEEPISTQCIGFQVPSKEYYDEGE